MRSSCTLRQFDYLFANQLVVIFPCCWDHPTELVAAAIDTLQQVAPHNLAKGHDQGNPSKHTLTSFLCVSEALVYLSIPAPIERPDFLLSLSHLSALAGFLP
jgi:hypothetical protein